MKNLNHIVRSTIQYRWCPGKVPDGSDETFYMIDDICHEWEQRTRLVLEFDEYRRVFQKDVNNYIVVSPDGKYQSKGAYVKKE